MQLFVSGVFIQFLDHYDAVLIDSCDKIIFRL